MLIFCMKKIVFLLFFILLISTASSEDTYDLKLRANHHPEFLRVVIEGAEPIISKALVNQKGKDIFVRFPYARFTIQEKKGPFNYQINNDEIILSPGHFNKFKVFFLKYPSRLVIDVYLVEVIQDDTPLLKQSTKGQVRRIKTINTLIIDPGHGGYDSGIINEDYREKNAVLDIAKRLKTFLNRDTSKCVLTRESDQFLPLKHRIQFVNSRDAEIFLSLHIGNHKKIVLYTPVISDSFDPYTRTFLVNKGPEEFTAKTKTLQNSLQKAITEHFGDDMVIIKPLPYSILSKIEAAGLIIELPSLNDVSYGRNFKIKVAQAIYKGLYLYEENTAH